MSSCLYCQSEWDQFRVVPRVVPCGHSYCENCIKLSVAQLNEFVCNECSAHYAYNDLCNSPVNRTLLSLCNANKDKDYSSICRQLNFAETGLKVKQDLTAVEDQLNEINFNSSNKKKPSIFEWQTAAGNTSFNSSTSGPSAFVTPCKQQSLHNHMAIFTSEDNNSSHNNTGFSSEQPRNRYVSQNCSETQNARVVGTMSSRFGITKPILIDFD